MAQICYDHIFLADLLRFSLIASMRALRSFFLVVSGITISQPSSFSFSFSFSLSFSRLLAMPMVLDSSLSSLESSSTGFKFFLRLTLRLFLSFFLGSRSSFLGMMLLLTMWCATLLLSLLPKLLSVLERICEVALANFLYSSSFFFFVFSFSISLILSSMTVSALRMRLPLARFSLMKLLLKVFQGRWMQYFIRQIAAKMSRKPSRKATRQVDERMITLRGQSKELSLISTQEKMTLVDRYCRTKMYFRRSHARSTPSLESLSRPLVPQERSSMRLKANIWSRLTQVGEQQMQERTDVIISTYFLKLKVQTIGSACPMITKMIRARRQTSGMMKFSSPSLWQICRPIDTVFATSSVTTINPYTPRMVEVRQYSFLKRQLLLLTSTPQRRLPQMRMMQRKLTMSGMESITLPMLNRLSLQLYSWQFWLSRKKEATAGTTYDCTAEIRVRFIATQKMDTWIQLTFFTKEQYNSCRQNRQEVLSQLCSCTQLNANHEPFIHRRRWPSNRVSDVTGSTTDSASGRQSRVQPRAWMPRHMIRSSARYMLESSREMFSFSDMAVFRYRFMRVSASSSSESTEGSQVYRSLSDPSWNFSSSSLKVTLFNAFQRQPEKAPGSTWMYPKAASKGLSSMWAKWYSNCWARWTVKKWSQQVVRQHSQSASYPSSRQPSSSEGFSSCSPMYPQTPPQRGFFSMWAHILQMASSLGFTPTSVRMQYSGSMSLQKPSKKSMCELSLPSFLCLTQKNMQLQLLAWSYVLAAVDSLRSMRGLRRSSSSRRTGQRMALSRRESMYRLQSSSVSCRASQMSLILMFFFEERYSCISSCVSYHMLFSTQKFSDSSSYFLWTSRGRPSALMSLSFFNASIQVSRALIRMNSLYWFSKSLPLRALSSSSVKRLTLSILSSPSMLKLKLRCSSSRRYSSSVLPYCLCLKPFLRSISLKQLIMFSVWSLLLLTFSMPSKITVMMISCGMMPALSRKCLQLSWMPLIVDFSMCFGQEYTQMQIASFIRRFDVRLNRDSSPWPAGWRAASGFSSKLRIYRSSMVIGSTSSSSNLSGWFSLRFTTISPWSLCRRISDGIRKILGKKSCFSRIFSQSGSSSSALLSMENVIIAAFRTPRPAAAGPQPALQKCRRGGGQEEPVDKNGQRLASEGRTPTPESSCLV